jgi:hypothetical protein
MPDFDVLRAMLFYVDEFPEKLHHRKESELLFPKIRQRCPELSATVLDRLDREHAVPARRRSATCERALLAFEVLGEVAPRWPSKRRWSSTSTLLPRPHGRRRRPKILPAAIGACWTRADWAELDTAFLANRDPLTGHEPAEELPAAVHERIVQRAPAPIGFA